MYIKIERIMLWLIGLFVVQSLYASEDNVRLHADSIMRQVISHAALYEHIVDSYEADIYVKGHTNVPKKNGWMRYAHLVFPVDKHPGETVFEMTSSTRYDAPNHYRNSIQAVNGNRLSSGKRYKEFFAFINLNVYSPTIYDKGMIMPLAPEAFKYYDFRLESVEDTAGLTVYNIRFTPRQWSQKLLSGHLYVTDQRWTIDRIEVNGHTSFSKFNLRIRFSRDDHRFILPESADLQVSYEMFGNKIESSFHSSFDYRAVAWVEEDYESKKHRPLDQTSYYKLTADAVPIVTDTTYWNSHRDLPLTKEEQTVYQSCSPSKQLQPPGNTPFSNYLQLGEQLTSTIYMDYKSTRIKYSGLLNPFQLAYSAKNGVTYRQQLRISKTFAHDRQLRFSPEIGFLFKKKEVRFNLNATWEYMPERKGTVSFTIANNNQSYSSEVMKKFNEEFKDSTFNFKNLNLKYFHHYYLRLANSIELANGLQLLAGITYHHRTPVKKKSENSEEGNLTKVLVQNYNDFTPMVGFLYTPRQYYWMDGYRKEYLYSPYPTFRMELARGIPNVFGSIGNYWRLEAGMHQSVKLGLSQRLSYNLSGGFFFNQYSTYFADFRYFAKKYFPEPWGDRFGGVFHNLGGDWYNASDKYIQGHLMYESPFILLRLIKPSKLKYIISERFYLSQLWTPVLPNYSELGYGLGSDICHIAIFLGFEEFKYQNFGLKFALELFR